MYLTLKFDQDHNEWILYEVTRTINGGGMLHPIRREKSPVFLLRYAAVVHSGVSVRKSPAVLRAVRREFEG